MKLLKNPVFWGFVGLLGGMIVAAIGWNKNESTIPENTHGAVTLIIIGCVMIVMGLLIFFTAGNSKD